MTSQIKYEQYLRTAKDRDQNAEVEHIDNKDVKVLLRKTAVWSPGMVHGDVVLVNRGNYYDPYVVWYWNSEVGGFCNGHYFTDLSDAVIDWLERN